MCGRYTQTTAPENLIFRFGYEDQGITLTPRYNLAPGQDAPVIVNEGSKTLRLMHWGLVPSWAKDPAIGNKMINARGETVAEKASFKRLLPRRRCLVLADGFYEWRREGKRKVPVWIFLKTREPFAFAGLWDSWRRPDRSELQSFTVITTEANEMLKAIHDRMPVILSGENEGKWLDLELKEPAQLTPLLKPYPSEMMDSYDVSTVVNNPSNDRPECIQEAL